MLGRVRGKNKALRTRRDTHGGPGVTRMLVLILVLETLAISLKAYHDRQLNFTSLKTETQRETLAIAEHLNGHIMTVAKTLEVTHAAGWSTRQTQDSLEKNVTVLTLVDALSSSDGTPALAAGHAASTALKAGHMISLSDDGNLVIAYQPEAGHARLAFIETARLLPTAQPGRRHFLIAEQTDVSITEGRGIDAICSPLLGGDVSACTDREWVAFSWLGLASISLYAFLLIGPALAILGLMHMLNAQLADSRRLERQERRNLQILNTVLKEAQAGVWAWDCEQETLTLSPQAAHLLGDVKPGAYDLEDFLKSAHPDHRASLHLALQHLESSRFISKSFALSDGRRWLDMRAHPDGHDTVIRGVLLDITSMRHALVRTREAENRLKLALESFSGPFALWDRNKRLVHWNQAFATVFALSDTIRQGMSHATMEIAQAANINERRQGEDNTEIVRVKQGQWYKIVERTTRESGLITLGLDVTEDVINESALQSNQKHLKKLISELERSEGYAAELARKLNEQKIEAERSANSKSAFLANMSHELRTPLNAINGFSEVLSEQLFGPLGDERYVGYARDILASGQHLLDMINDILDMAKIEAGKTTVDLRPIDITEPVDAAIRMIRRRAEDKSIKLTFTAENALPRIDADHRAIKQMILNLVSNAIKFTDEGGLIHVSIARQADMVCVAVQDNGIGIPADALPKLAQPFEQVSHTQDRNYEGTGLGLALTKAFAEMHGGKLTIASCEGEGTRVSFLIPVNATGSDPADLAA